MNGMEQMAWRWISDVQGLTCSIKVPDILFGTQMFV